MHLEFAIAASRWLSLAGAPCAVPGDCSGAQASWADRNAGDCVSMLEKFKPFGLGSGKFGTPCVRMQAAKATAPLETVADECSGAFEDPHAASRNATPIVTTAIDGPRAQRSSGLVLDIYSAGGTGSGSKPVLHRGR